MQWLTHWLWVDNKFLGVEWGFWKMVGWMGNIVFSSRFLVQWWATEKHKRVVVPYAFWWLSLTGSFCLLSYGLHLRDSVIIFAYLFTFIPYSRNLIISHRVAKNQMRCSNCSSLCPPQAKFCPECGVKLDRPTAD